MPFLGSMVVVASGHKREPDSPAVPTFRRWIRRISPVQDQLLTATGHLRCSRARARRARAPPTPLGKPSPGAWSGRGVGSSPAGAHVGRSAGREGGLRAAMAPWLRSVGLVAGSSLAFAALRWALSRCPLPAHVRRDATRTWRWKNLLVSFAHSVVAGLWAVVGMWQLPGAFDDLVRTTSPSAHLLLCFSTGYFIHDSLDIIICRQSRASWEYLVHHAVASSGLLSGIFLDRFVAAGLVSMFVEISNIFLTMRMMMRLGKLPLQTFYEVNKYLNLVAYFLFRLAPQAYLTWFFVRHVEMRGQGAFLMVNLVLLDAMILMYFSRLLRSDFYPGGHQSGSDNEKKYLID